MKNPETPPLALISRTTSTPGREFSRWWLRPRDKLSKLSPEATVAFKAWWKSKDESAISPFFSSTLFFFLISRLICHPLCQNYRQVFHDQTSKNTFSAHVSPVFHPASPSPTKPPRLKSSPLCCVTFPFLKKEWCWRWYAGKALCSVFPKVLHDKLSCFTYSCGESFLGVFWGFFLQLFLLQDEKEQIDTFECWIDPKGPDQMTEGSRIVSSENLLKYLPTISS